MTLRVQDLIVRKSLSIQAPVSHVFDVFAHRIDAWWPRSHHIGKDPNFVARLEPRVGGRWYEVCADGVQCDWGRVLVWEPPHRLVLSWEINADFQHDPSIDNEVEVLFRAEGDDRTRVELEHRKIERYGDKAAAMQAVFDSERGWAGILKELQRVSEARNA